MSAVELLKQATKQACQEFGAPWPDAADEEFSNGQIARVADLFADLVVSQHTAELEREAALMRARMERLEAANQAWSDKTDWVQKTSQWYELGMHRADVLRTRIEHLEAERTTLVEAICKRISQACGPRSSVEMAVRRDFLPERPCVVHVAPDDTEGGAI